MKKSIFIIALLLCVLPFHATGQTKKEADKLLKQAEALMAGDRIEEGYALSLDARDMYEELGLVDTYEYASALWIEALTLNLQGDFPGCEATMARTIQIMEPIAHEHPEDYMGILMNYSTVLSNVGKMEEGTAIIGRLESFYGKLEKPGKKVQAKYLSSIGNLLNYYGRSQEALPILEKAAESSRSAFGRHSSEFLETCTALATCYSSLSMTDKCKALVVKILAELKNDRDSNGIRVTLVGALADCESGAGDFGSALEHYLEMEQLTRQETPVIKEYLILPIVRQSACLNMMGRFDEALAKNSEALRLIGECDREGTYTHLTVLSGRALIYAKQGDKDKLLETGREIEMMGRGDINCSSAISELAEAYKSTGLYDDAKNCYLEAISSIGDHPSFQTMRLYALEGLFNCAEQAGDEQAMRQYAPVLVKQYESMGQLDYLYPNALAALVREQLDAGNYGAAKDLLHKAGSSVLQTYGRESTMYASVLSGIASVNHSIGLKEDALRQMQESTGILRPLAENVPDVFLGDLKTLAGYEQEAGHIDEAIAHFVEAQQFAEKAFGRMSTQNAQALEDLSNCKLFLEGDLFGTAKLMRYNLDVMENYYGDNPAGLVQSYVIAANSFFAAGDKDSGELYLNKARGLVSSMPSDNLQDNLKIVFSMSNMLPAQELLKLYEPLVARETEIASNADDYRYYLFQMCSLHAALGHNDEVRRYGETALEVFPDIPANKLTRLSIAQLLYNCGSSDKAMPVFRKHYAESSAAGSLSMTDMISTGYLMKYCFDNDDVKGYNKYCPEFTRQLRSYIKSNFSNMTQQEKNALWEMTGESLLFGLPGIALSSRSPEICKAAYDGLLTAKGILLSTEVDLRKAIRDSGNAEAAGLYDRIQMGKTRLGNMQEGAARDSLQAAVTSDEEKLISMSTEFGDYMKNFSVSWENVRKNLRQKEAAVEFAVCNDNGRTKYAAFVVQRNYPSPHVIELFDSGSLRQDDLFNLVWKPLDAELAGVSTIYFSPAGELNNLPIEYAADGNGIRQDQRFKLYRLSSTREIDRRRSVRRAGSSVLYGGIDYNGTPDVSQQEESVAAIRNRADFLRDERGSISGVIQLPGTLREIDEIQQVLESRHIPFARYDGSKATEESFKALSGNAPAIMHLATHGFFWNESQAQKAKFLQSPDGSGIMEEDKALSRSGLMLAGVNNTIRGKGLPDSLEDGVLTAREISVMDLQGTDLLVLAACKSGVGEVKGDGVFGLQRGFKKAGVRTIVMSLWNVDDNATQLLMSSFYTFMIKDGKSPCEALELAQEIVRRQYPDPKYWAAFIVLDGN